MKSTKRGARRERRGFTTEFQAEAVRLLAERRAAGATATQVGRELDVRPDQLRAWAGVQHGSTGAIAAGAGETLEQENRRLRCQVATLQQEQAFVKNGLGAVRATCGTRNSEAVRLSGRAKWPMAYW